MRSFNNKITNQSGYKETTQCKIRRQGSASNAGNSERGATIKSGVMTGKVMEKIGFISYDPVFKISGIK